MIDLNNPETFRLSPEEYEWYLKNDDHISNSAARKNPEESMLVAMRNNREHYKKMAINGVSVHEIIKGL